MQGNPSGKPAASPDDLGLTGRQLEVLALMMQGKSNKAICRALDMAEQTVKKHVTSILKALNANNRTEAVIAAGALGWQLPQLVENAAGGPAAPSNAMTISKFGHTRESLVPKSADPPQRSALAPPEKPSIVVLPFANLSGDPGQDYFADGMVEDLTIALGRLRWLFVIGSFSAFMYKNRAVDIRQVGSELGVRYVLRGSVRKAANRVRITAELCDASHGGHIWADRFEGELDNVFAMQDRVAVYVSTMIAPALRSEEIERVRRKQTENLTAYDLLLRALPARHKTFAQSQEALRLLYKAIELDPSYGSAYGFGAWCYSEQKQFGWIKPDDPRLTDGVRLANVAAERSDDSESLWMAGFTLTLLAGEFERSLALAQKAVILNPNSANAWWTSGLARAYLRDFKNSLEDFERGRRLDPLNPIFETFWMGSAICHFLAEQYQEASDAADKALAQLPNFPPALRLRIVTSGLLGRLDEGRACVERLLAVNPDASVASMRAYWEPVWRRNPGALKSYLEGLRASGLPEG